MRAPQNNIQECDVEPTVRIPELAGSLMGMQQRLQTKLRYTLMSFSR